MGDGEGSDVFARSGEVGGDGQAGGGAAGGEEGGEELVVAVWGFDKELSTAVAGAVGFEVSDGGGSAAGVVGEVAVEFELLAVEAAGHEGEEDGAWADEGADGGAGLVGDGGEELAGVGDAGAAGFTDETDGATCAEGGAEDRLYFFFRLVDGVPFIVIDHHFFPEGLEVTAGRAFILHEEDAALLHGIQQVGGERGSDLIVEPAGDEIKSGRVWAAHDYSRFW